MSDAVGVEGRWAVILGASSGTGAAIARAVAEAPGLHVFGMHRGRYQAQADDVAAAVKTAGRQMVMHRGDAGTFDGAQRGADALLEAAGPRRVHLFVHSIANASVGRLAIPLAERLHPKQIDKTFTAMAHSFVYWAQALIDRDLLAPGARLLGLTNPLDTSILRNSGAIGAAKAALESYVRHLAMELGPLGHRVNLLKFGTVMTPALSHVFDEAALKAMARAHERMIPSGAMCTVEEVGRFVGLLCSAEAAYFNGATIDFTGGMTQHLLDLVLNAPSP